MGFLDRFGIRTKPKETNIKKKNIFNFREARSKKDSMYRKRKNVEKCMRIARATTGHESQVNFARADKLLKRYGF